MVNLPNLFINKYPNLRPAYIVNVSFVGFCVLLNLKRRRTLQFILKDLEILEVYFLLLWGDFFFFFFTFHSFLFLPFHDERWLKKKQQACESPVSR